MKERGLSVFVNATILTNSTASLGVSWESIWDWEVEWSCKFFSVAEHITKQASLTAKHLSPDIFFNRWWPEQPAGLKAGSRFSKFKSCESEDYLWHVIERVLLMRWCSRCFRDWLHLVFCPKKKNHWGNWRHGIMIMIPSVPRRCQKLSHKKVREKNMTEGFLPTVAACILLWPAYAEGHLSCGA